MVSEFNHGTLCVFSVDWRRPYDDRYIVNGSCSLREWAVSEALTAVLLFSEFFLFAFRPCIFLSGKARPEKYS